ncbi:solute carrier family 22 member 18-like [Gigantopelta aegis]|uniref:solute carrier family 22 member 18-like n=1 Tax=Gigantopelta aegis TaxID=1735272 RepID=UPI001B88BDC3|nr:solute carrier family 22 member 18-like [Gigantopelta aegis]
MQKRSVKSGDDKPTAEETMKTEPLLSPDGAGDQTVKIFNFKVHKVVLVVHINIFLYATCFWIQTGTLPYLSKRLGVDPVVFGYLQTTFAVVQLAGGPLYGRFGDLFGGRAAMTLAFSASALTYFLLGLSYNIPLLFVSRLPSMFMHAMQGGQMIVTDLGEVHKRADALGKLGMSYGVGMVIGPLVGGLITKHVSEEFAAFLASAGSLLSIVLVLAFVPKHTKKPEAKVAEEASSSSVFNFKKIINLVLAPGVLFLLLIKIGSGIPIGIFQSMFQVVAIDTFHLAADQNGFVMSYIGITTMIVQGIGIGILTKRFSENSILKWSAFILVWSYLLMAFCTNIWQLCAVFLPLVIGLTTKNVVLSAAVTKTVSDADTGAMLGLNMAVHSLVRTVSPTIGGYMLEHLGFPSFGYLGFVLCSIVTVVLFIKFRQPS